MSRLPIIETRGAIAPERILKAVKNEDHYWAAAVNRNNQPIQAASFGELATRFGSITSDFYGDDQDVVVLRNRIQTVSDGDVFVSEEGQKLGGLEVVTGDKFEADFANALTMRALFQPENHVDAPNSSFALIQWGNRSPNVVTFYAQDAGISGLQQALYSRMFYTAGNEPNRRTNIALGIAATMPYSRR